MIEAISTGKNKCYGKKGETIRFYNAHLEFVLRKGYIKNGTIKFLPTWYGGKRTTPEEKVRLMKLPEKKVYVHNEIEMMERATKRILKELDFIKKRQVKLIKLLVQKE